jgi:hypothetical protein
LQTHAKQFHEFIPDENDWKNVMIPLNSYVGNFVSIKIVNWNMSGNNIYIDNVLVEGGDSTLNEIGFAKTQINTVENSSSVDKLLVVVIEYYRYLFLFHQHQHQLP